MNNKVHLLKRFLMRLFQICNNLKYCVTIITQVYATIQFTANAKTCSVHLTLTEGF